MSIIIIIIIIIRIITVQQLAASPGIFGCNMRRNDRVIIASRLTLQLINDGVQDYTACFDG